MDTYGKIKQKIRNIAGDKSQNTIIQTAEVVSVNGETCTVRIDTLQIGDVRLRSVINGNSEKLLITPKAGSYVLIADLSAGNYRDFAVIDYSEIEKISVEIAQMNVNIDKNGIVITGSGENLFTVLSDLIAEVARIIVVQGTGPNVAALNLIKQRLNKILK